MYYLLNNVGINAGINKTEKEANYDLLTGYEFDIPMTKNMREEVDAMSNLGQGIREKAVIETTAGIVINIMRNKKVSFDEAFDSTFVSENEREHVKACVEEKMGLVK